MYNNIMSIYNILNENLKILTTKLYIVNHLYLSIIISISSRVSPGLLRIRNFFLGDWNILMGLETQNISQLCLKGRKIF